MYNKHIKSLQAWRGLAAFTLVIYHFPTNSFLHQNSYVQSGLLLVIFFFVLSGFVLGLNYYDKLYNFSLFKNFMNRRFWRLYPIHIVLLILYALLEVSKYIFSHYSGISLSNGRPPFTGHMNLEYLVQSLLLVQGLFSQIFVWNPVDWSISTEFYTYIIFGLILCFSKKNSIFYILFFVLLFLAIDQRHLIDAFDSYSKYVDNSPESFICHHQGCSTNWIHRYIFGWETNFPNYSTISYFFSQTIYGFFIGIIINLFYRKFSNLKISEIFCWISLIITIYFICVGTHLTYYLLLFGILILSSCYLDENSILGKILNSGALQFLGKISYSLYMIHQLIGYVFKQFLKIVIKVDANLTENNTAESYNFSQIGATFYTLVYIFISLIAASILYYYVENKYRIKSNLIN